MVRMRASLLVLCALSFALAGCRGSAQKAPPPAEETSTAPPEEIPPAIDGLPDDMTAPPGVVFVPRADGRVAPIVRKDAPNMRYAALGHDACLTELGRRGIAFEEVPPEEWAPRSRAPIARVDKATGKTRTPSSKKSSSKKPSSKKRGAKDATPSKRVRSATKAKAASAPKPAAEAQSAVEPTEPATLLAPVRLQGPLHGISIHSALPEKVRAKSTIEIFDCRLVLALDDFTTVLAKHDIVEVIHMSAFRSVRDRGCTPKYTGKQHCAALAVDIGTFRKKDGSVLDVDKDFNGKIGAATCTPGTGPSPVTPAATALWDIVCDAADRGLFHVMLTPNFNVEHKNHFHVEITPDVAWMLIK